MVELEVMEVAAEAAVLVEGQEQEIQQELVALEAEGEAAEVLVLEVLVIPYQEVMVQQEDMAEVEEEAAAPIVVPAITAEAALVALD